MAVLIGAVPPGFTFHDLVGGPMINTPPRSSAFGEQGANSTSGQLTRERRMRIYLPDGAMKEMTLTEYQEFLVSYHISDLSQAVANASSSREGPEQTAEAAVPCSGLDRGSLNTPDSPSAQCPGSLREQTAPSRLGINPRLQRRRRMRRSDC